MARIARLVIPGYPHHVVQRGNRLQTVFFNDQDKEVYIELLQKHAIIAGIDFWAYSLMDNHVHLIAVPKCEDSLAIGIGEAHRRYTRMINFREGWRGYLWQGRFASYPLDERYLYAAVRYVERNPVRAGLVKRAEDYLWSSARVHVLKQKDSLLSYNFMLTETADWASYLAEDDREEHVKLLRQCERTGRPLGNEDFISRLEKITERTIRKKKPGRKKK